MPSFQAGEALKDEAEETPLTANAPIASNRGLGFLIEYNSGMFNAAGVFAAVSILVLIGVVLTELLTRFDASSGPARTRAGF